MNPISSRRIRRWFFALLPGLVAGLASLTAATTTSYVRTAVSAAVDGVDCADLVKWEGGDPRGQIGSDGNTGSGKRVLGVYFAPLVLEFPLPPPPAIQNWIASFCDNQHTPKSVVLTESSVGATTAEAVEYSGSVLTEVRLSGFDAGGKDAPHVTLVIRPGAQRKIAAMARTPSSAVRSKVTVSRLTIAGIATSNQISHLDDLTIRLPGTDSVGSYRMPESGKVEVANLVLTLASFQTADWKAWRDAVLGIGPQSTVGPIERTAVLDYLPPTLLSPLFSIKFSGLGLVRVSRVPNGPPERPQDQAELYCNAISVSTASTSPTPPTDSTAATPTPTASTGTPAPTTPDPATTPASTPATTPPPTDLTPVGTRTPIAPPGNSLVKTATLIPLAQTAVADLGARDPTGFPRPAGLARLTFTSNIVPTQARETATYSSTSAFDDVVERYSAAVTSAGWVEKSRAESGDTVTRRMMILEWHKAASIAEVRIYSAKTGSEVSLTVTTDRTAKQ